MTIAEALSHGAETLSLAGIPDPKREAGSLLQFATARDRAYLVAHPEYRLTEDEAESFRTAIERRSAREPFQRIVGRQEFYGLDFLVTSDVLIPRHETELIVERAIELLAELPSPRFLEIGIGSGCISVAILKHCPKAAGLAVDISEPAIEVARRNAEMHRVGDRLEILLSDVYKDLPKAQFDLIVSNPPYVPISEYAHLQPEVRDHDPKIAVTDDSTGLTIVERIVAEAPRFLFSGGHLLMEIGYGQHERVKAMFDLDHWTSAAFLDDLQGIPRTLDAEAA